VHKPKYFEPMIASNHILDHNFISPPSVELAAIYRKTFAQYVSGIILAAIFFPANPFRPLFPANPFRPLFPANTFPPYFFPPAPSGHYFPPYYFPS
jgi:hypothetical protein